MMDLPTVAASLPGLVIGLTLHEFAHAWSASLLGDDFARRQGRVSLNPLRHLSPLGTLAIFLLPFGWGRPVMVNIYNFRRPRRDYLLTSLAGPLANVVVFAACVVLMQLTRHTYGLGAHWAPFVNLAHWVVLMTAAINLALATLNLIPIPPLDGSKIWPCLVPSLKPAAKTKTTWIFVGVLVLLLYTGALDPAIGFVFDGAARFLPSSDQRLYHEQMIAGNREWEANQFAEAERSYTRAMGINPFSDECFYDRAIVREWQEHWPAALEDASRAIEMDGSRPEYYECRAKALGALGRGADANADRARAGSLRKAQTPLSGPASGAASLPSGP